MVGSFQYWLSNTACHSRPLASTWLAVKRTHRGRAHALVLSHRDAFELALAAYVGLKRGLATVAWSFDR